MNFEKTEICRNIEATEFFRNECWQAPTAPCDFSSLKWKPDFVNQDAVMCIPGAPVIPHYLTRRIVAAANSGRCIVCVADLGILAHDSNVRLLSDVDADLVWLDENGKLNTRRRLLKTLAEELIPLSTELRTALVAKGIERCESASTASEKGKRLEQLLHFMLSQVKDFRVLKCNWVTRTEELDCVVQIRSFSSRAWAMLRAPYIIVEGKNRAEKLGQESVSKLRSIIDGKRGTCRIGFLVSLSGFSSKAKDQVLRFSAEDNIFVLLGKSELVNWGNAGDYDEALESLVSAAMLD